MSLVRGVDRSRKDVSLTSFIEKLIWSPPPIPPETYNNLVRSCNILRSYL